MPYLICIITKTKEHIHLIRMIEIIHNGEKTIKPYLETKTSYIMEATTSGFMNEKNTIDLKQMKLLCTITKVQRVLNVLTSG